MAYCLSNRHSCPVHFLITNHFYPYLPNLNFFHLQRSNKTLNLLDTNLLRQLLQNLNPLHQIFNYPPNPNPKNSILQLNFVCKINAQGTEFSTEASPALTRLVRGRIPNQSTLFSVICHLPSVICHLSSFLRPPAFCFSNNLQFMPKVSTIYHLCPRYIQFLPPASCLLNSVLRRLSSVVCHLPSVISRLSSVVRPPLSPFTV